jgi:hypothetical protein
MDRFPKGCCIRESENPPTLITIVKMADFVPKKQKPSRKRVARGPAICHKYFV